MPDTEPVSKTIVGVCEEITERNGWHTFSINVGTQYPERLSTKLPALIEQARAVGSETATWTFKQSQGKENPNRPGTYYQNKYLDGVEVGVSEQPTASGSQTRPAESAHAPVAIGDKERAITRMACLKAAAELYAGQGQPFPPEDYNLTGDAPVYSDPVVLAVLQAANRFERDVYRDIDEIPFG